MMQTKVKANVLTRVDVTPLDVPMLTGLGSQGASLSSPLPGKRVLIMDFDLYKSVGGGQSAYRRLVEQFPQNTYYYFLQGETPTQKRPANTRVIPFEYSYYANVGDLPAEMGHFYNDYLQCWQFAAAARKSLGTMEFDVIDTPDYVTRGLFARSAFESHGIRVGVVALALHGTITSALKDEWSLRPAPSRMMAEIRLREHLQYRAADVRYALSAAYAHEWEKYTNIQARPLDPLLMVGPMAPQQAPAGDPPDVMFIGRRERRKGPDLFVDIGWCLDPATYRELIMIGGDTSGNSGVSSSQVLPTLIANRKMNLPSIETLSHAELDDRFRGRSLVVLPSRYDQFNLVALEAWRLGCPAFVSNKAGAADWLLKRYPKLSNLVIDIDCSRSGAGAVRDALLDYDGTRNRVVDTFLSGRLSTVDIDQAGLIYEPNSAIDKSARASLAEVRLRFDSFNRPRELSELGAKYRAKRWVSKTLPRSVVAVGRAVVRTPRAIVKMAKYRPKMPKRPPLLASAGRLLQRTGYLHDDAFGPIVRASEVQGTRSRLLTLGERTSTDVAKKLSQVSGELGAIRVARAQIFRDMARLERKRGGDLIAATYCLRIMRWLGRDVYRDLDFVMETLRANKFTNEADVAHAMFADPAMAERRCSQLLAVQYQRNLTKPDLPLEIHDDHRGSGQPKVSVIVSLYNAESKVRTLLENMRLQSITRDRKLEVILVDSGSPSNEYKVFKEYAASHDLPILYVRSQGRETIQCAWNRGIKLARAPYLSFLGCDEGLHPDALAELATALDTHADVDWVMADSIVTNVDPQGIFVGDIMTYNRAGYDQNLVYLETCYLSWVGGLYRKSVHDRFGYYDEAFRAAGDTEFKGRLLTRIKTMHLPKLLGVFNNYPEERTTQHPRAEIEDLRAWYLHRTIAGVAYSFDAHPVERAEDLFRRSLSYRKSFCSHISTDFDLAQAVGHYLRQRGDSGDFGEKAAASGNALVALTRAFEQLDLQLSPRRRQLQVTKALMTARARELRDMQAFGLEGRPQYRLMNDNRYEQHWWSWST
jgi:glycosyltransferase involved in cell wall biosynthesis